MRSLCTHRSRIGFSAMRPKLKFLLSLNKLESLAAEKVSKETSAAGQSIWLLRSGKFEAAFRKIEKELPLLGPNDRARLRAGITEAGQSYFPGSFSGKYLNIYSPTSPNSNLVETIFMAPTSLQDCEDCERLGFKRTKCEDEIYYLELNNTNIDLCAENAGMVIFGEEDSYPAIVQAAICGKAVAKDEGLASLENLIRLARLAPPMTSALLRARYGSCDGYEPELWDLPCCSVQGNLVYGRQKVSSHNLVNRWREMNLWKGHFGKLLSNWGYLDSSAKLLANHSAYFAKTHARLVADICKWTGW